MKRIPESKVTKIVADNYARENVRGYAEYSEAKKLEIRWTIMSGRRNGVSESEIKALANISAKTDVGIGFANGINGDGIYYDIDGERTIYVNAKGSRKIESTIIHELAHSLKGKAGYGAIEEYANKNIDEAKRERIEKEYRAFYKANGLMFDESVLKDEITAHYVESVLGEKEVA